MTAVKFLSFYAILLFCLVTNVSAAVIGGRSAADEFPNAKDAMLADVACTGGDRAVANALRAGGNPNGKGKEGDTPLFWALKCENLAGMEILLKAGADPNYQIPGHFSATYVAATMFNPAPLKLILKYGGDPNAVEAHGRSIILAAIDLGVSGHGWDNFDSLVNAGGKIESPNINGTSLLDELAGFGAYDKVEQLLLRGYGGDYVVLGRAVTIRKSDPVSHPNLAAARKRVIAYLESKGVKFPVPPLLQLYSGRVFMESDGALTVLWYGGYSKDGAGRVETRTEIIKPGSAACAELLNRVGGLTPLHSKGIPRGPNDPEPLRH